MEGTRSVSGNPQIAGSPSGSRISNITNSKWSFEINIILSWANPPKRVKTSISFPFCDGDGSSTNISSNGFSNDGGGGDGGGRIHSQLKPTINSNIFNDGHRW